jgi:hypothetical protein
MVCRVLGVLFIGAVVMGILPSQILGEQQRPCHDDIQRLCKDLKGAELGACLHQHADDLSPACKARIADVKELVRKRGEELKKACNTELQKFCKSVKQGPFRMMQCLREHEADLSSGCKAEVDKRPARPAPGTAGPKAAAAAPKNPAATPAH